MPECCKRAAAVASVLNRSSCVSFKRAAKGRILRATRRPSETCFGFVDDAHAAATELLEQLYGPIWVPGLSAALDCCQADCRNRRVSILRKAALSCAVSSRFHSARSSVRSRTGVCREIRAIVHGSFSSLASR